MNFINYPLFRIRSYYIKEVYYILDDQDHLELIWKFSSVVRLVGSSKHYNYESDFLFKGLDKHIDDSIHTTLSTSSYGL